MADFLQSAINATSNPLTFGAQTPNDFSQNGFIVPSVPGADGNGLPSQKVQSGRQYNTSYRPIIHWFVPEFGIVQMYVNPKMIRYAFKKLITQERTKGGYNLQYWGEQLSTLSISGTTASSGIEGINVLYEIYRAEQYAFDVVGLTLAANTSAADGAANQIIGGIGNALGGPVGGSIAKSLFGTSSAQQSLTTANLPTLAQYAFGVEMYYQGWVFRGYFDSMNVTESADNIGLFEYDLTFFVTERRGYRVNNFAWQRSAIDGPSDPSVPLSFTSTT